MLGLKDQNLGNLGQFRQIQFYNKLHKDSLRYSSQLQSEGTPSPSTASDAGINLQFEHLWGDSGAEVDVEYQWDPC